MSDSRLPEDVMDFLKLARDHCLWPTAETLVQKYAPPTRSLTEIGEVRYERVFVDRNGARFHEHYRPSALKFGPETYNWPDDNGICDLLNDGWQLMSMSELQRGIREAYNPTDPAQPWQEDSLTYLKGFAAKFGETLVLDRDRT